MRDTDTADMHSTDGIRQIPDREWVPVVRGWGKEMESDHTWGWGFLFGDGLFWESDR